MNNNPPKGNGQTAVNNLPAKRLTKYATDSSPYRQHEAMTIAQLALKGHSVTRGTDKDFFVGKWGLIRHCENYAALIAFALMVGVTS